MHRTFGENFQRLGLNYRLSSNTDFPVPAPRLMDRFQQSADH